MVMTCHAQVPAFVAGLLKVLGFILASWIICEARELLIAACHSQTKALFVYAAVSWCMIVT